MSTYSYDPDIRSRERMRRHLAPDARRELDRSLEKVRQLTTEAHFLRQENTRLKAEVARLRERR